MILKKVERYFKGVITGKNNSTFAWCLRKCLTPFSWAYCLGAKSRNWLYDQDWMRCYIPPVPLVISVGNIVAGGTGKTPLTILLTKAFYDAYPVAILSRGYRSKAEKLEEPTILCEGNGPLFPASYCGDEPCLFARYFPKATIIVGKDRKKSASLASQSGAQIIILDDGMQYRSLDRDLEVVVIDAQDPFGQNYHLPRGFLREEVQSLKRADLIVINHVKSEEEYHSLTADLARFSQAPTVATNYQLVQIKNLKGDTLSIPRMTAVGMFCTIANPHYFKHILEGYGLVVAAEYCLPDHSEIRERGLAHFAKQCQTKGCEWIICTEKDRVKLDDKWTLNLPIAWVESELKTIHGEQNWHFFLSKAQELIKDRAFSHIKN